MDDLRSAIRAHEKPEAELATGPSSTRVEERKVLCCVIVCLGASYASDALLL